MRIYRKEVTSQMTRRTSGGNARNGVNCSQCARHSFTIAG